MKIGDENLFSVNVGLGSRCDVKNFWCDIKQQEIKELAD